MEMAKIRVKRLLLAMLVVAPLLQAKVTVEREQMTFTLDTADYGARGSAVSGGMPGNYPVKGTKREIQETVEVIKVKNGLVEAWICPGFAGRLLRVKDLKTGIDYFNWQDRFQDYLPWHTGGVKSSFPFFEHGTFLRQPAGHRVVRNADGSVTVAMDQRYSHHIQKADRERYGRYSDEALNILVTVYPGSTAVEWRQRKENLNPTPRSERCWNVVFFPQERFTKQGFKTKRVRDPETGKKVKKQIPAEVADMKKMREHIEFIYPVPFVGDHGPTLVHTAPHHTHWTENGPAEHANWNVSYFALYAPHGFSGAWYPKQKVNRLRINSPDRDKGPGLKLYSAYWPDFMELWGGQGIVFEAPSPARAGYVPVDFSHWFWITQGMDRVDFANRDVAVAVNEGVFELMASREANARVSDKTGKVVAEGPVGPYTILSGRYQGTLKVLLDGKLVLEQALPLEMPVPSRDLVYLAEKNNPNKIPNEVMKDFQFILDQRNRKRVGYWEEESFAHNEGVTRLRDVRGAAKNIQGGDPAYINSIARAVYRLGYFDEAERLAKLAPGPEADFTLGLLAWEQGGTVHFGEAGPESGYHRALLAMQNGDKADAVKQVDVLLADSPDAWLPRLARCYWAEDKPGAKVLAAENPASPEAQLVLKLLGETHELNSLVSNNPSAKVHVEIFEGSLTQGTWSHIPRFPQENL